MMRPHQEEGEGGRNRWLEKMKEAERAACEPDEGGRDRFLARRGREDTDVQCNGNGERE